MAVNEAARIALIKQAVSAAGDHAETLRVRWRDRQSRMPVIRVKIDATVLNPRSHRIRAQLESNAAAADLIRTDPEGDEAQDAIRGLLRATPGFDALMQNIKDERQKDPGIITRNGLLVNANTRAVALRDIGTEYIEVAVLPDDAQPDEIYDLELDLQVAQDYRQDYSFTNELLFIDDLITKLNRDEKDVAYGLRWATATKASSIKPGMEKVRRYVRHLDVIRDIQRLSGNKIPITDFDDAAQALQEFDIAYEGLRDKDPRSAERLKQGRVLGLLVELGYDPQCSVNAEWIESHLWEAFAEQELLRTLIDPILDQAKQEDADDAEDESDLDLFADGNLGDTVPDVFRVVEKLIEALSTSAQEESVILPTTDGPKPLNRDAVKGAVKEAMRTAAEDAKAAARAGNALNVPAQLVKEAATRLSRCERRVQQGQGPVRFQRH